MIRDKRRIISEHIPTQSSFPLPIQKHTHTHTHFPSSGNRPVSDVALFNEPSKPWSFEVCGNPHAHPNEPQTMVTAETSERRGHVGHKVRPNVRSSVSLSLSFSLPLCLPQSLSPSFLCLFLSVSCYISLSGHVCQFGFYDRELTPCPKNEEDLLRFECIKILP